MGQQSHANYSSQPSNSVISLKEWMITILLMAIPIVNLIMLFVWAFGGGTNASKSNYAKATLIWMGIGIVLYVIIFVLILGAAFSGAKY
ncbi:hypothetical protein GK047_13310 [Paenibacillus sp. SYP-B3998]|uniref:Uncharacterized protein n=1 Tax=Paenibacillus sp. SYP-B3998 TaxID=2678564 RepID=A0A6G3ZXP2_9BACL|nr:hypothetical protein [Paenibacillus sp. SYP-B3998]